MSKGNKFFVGVCHPRLRAEGRLSGVQTRTMKIGNSLLTPPLERGDGGI